MKVTHRCKKCGAPYHGNDTLVFMGFFAVFFGLILGILPGLIILPLVVRNYHRCTKCGSHFQMERV